MTGGAHDCAKTGIANRMDVHWHRRRQHLDGEILVHSAQLSGQAWRHCRYPCRSPRGTRRRAKNRHRLGRVTGIDRFNPFFPAEAAQELADENIRFLDTVLSGSRDHLEAEVLILGTTGEGDAGAAQLSPLTYPVKPSGEVLYPPPEDVRRLLTGEEDNSAKLQIGTLIARGDVEVSLSARHIVSRHLAILAMTGGGKTVAARRIIRELIDLKYPLVIFDPHGDYLGFFEKR